VRSARARVARAHEELDVAEGMACFGFSGVSEEFGDLGQVLVAGLAREEQVAPVGFALAAHH